MQASAFVRANYSEAEHIRFLTPVAVSDIVELVRQCNFNGSTDLQIGSVNLSHLIGVSDGRHPARATLCFVDKPPDLLSIDSLREALVIATPTLATRLNSCSVVVVSDPRAVFIDLLVCLGKNPGFACFASVVTVPPGLNPLAEIHPTAVIEDGVFVGEHAQIGAGCVVKRGSAIDRGVTIRENTVIGGHGIALYKAQDGRLLRFPDLGGVIIEEGVEIGTSCSIPSGVLTPTTVGHHSVIGNLCNVGHGVKIGSKVWISVGTLIGGNSSVGANSTLGLGVAVRDNLRIGHDCSIGMGSVVMQNVPDGASLLGNPARQLPQVSSGPDR